MDINNSEVIAEGRRWVEVEQGIGEINGNGKNTIKNNVKTFLKILFIFYF